MRRLGDEIAEPPIVGRRRPLSTTWYARAHAIDGRGSVEGAGDVLRRARRIDHAGMTSLPARKRHACDAAPDTGSSRAIGRRRSNVHHGIYYSNGVEHAPPRTTTSRRSED